MAGRSFTRHTNGAGNRIRAEHINELQVALEEDDARIDLKTDDAQFTSHVDDTDNPHNVTKDQLGLGNVDNTSDMAKPVSTAQQAALDGKAAKADAVPAGGVYGQVLTVTHSGKQWVDPPGIVYPSLLLSPDGSVDRNGSIAPVNMSGVTIVPGQYGNAWNIPASSSPRIDGRFNTETGSCLVRYWVNSHEGSANQYIVAFGRITFVGDDFFGVSDRYEASATLFSTDNGGSQKEVSIIKPTRPAGAYRTLYLEWTKTSITGVIDNGTPATLPRSGIAGSGQFLYIGSRGAFGLNGGVESVLLFPSPVPAAEKDRIFNQSRRWTMQSTAVNMALQSQPPATPSGASLLNYFPPNRKIATGGATLRTAPGPSTQAITTLAAGTDVHDTRQAVSVSSVSYSLVVTAFGNAWVPSSTLV